MNREHVSALDRENKKKENLAIIIGFTAIVFVIIFTLLRGRFADTNKQSLNQNNVDTKNSSMTAYETIGAKDLNKKLSGAVKDNESITLLDIRPFDAYIAEHIVDAVNIPLDEFPVGTKLDAHNLIVVIGANSLDENIGKAANQLKDENFKNITTLSGGMDLWKEQIGLTVTYGDPKSFVDQSKVTYIDPENLNDALAQNIPSYIVDVRTNDEYSKGHITGAVNIPFEELEKRRKEIFAKKVVVVGANELQEFQASVQIYDMLMASPFVMRGAMPKWEEKKFAVVK